MSPQVRIYFLGESFVNGTGDPECLGWAGRICQNVYKKGYEITYYNLGVRRETSTELKQRWLQEVTYRLPKEYDGRVVFSFGVNDTTMENGKTRVNVNDSIANAREIISAAKPLYPVLMVSPSPVVDEKQNHRIAQLANKFSEVCNQLKVPYLNVFPLLNQSQVWKREAKENDSAHPRTAGYTELAQIVQNWDGWLNWFPESKI